MTTDTIKFKRGVKSKLNNLSYGEPAYISDEGELYIGTQSGVEKLTSNKEVKELSSQLAQKASKVVVNIVDEKLSDEVDYTKAFSRIISRYPDGVTIKIPSNTTIKAETIVLNKKTQIEGASDGTSVLMQNENATTHFITISNESDYMCSLKNLYIKGNPDNPNNIDLVHFANTKEDPLDNFVDHYHNLSNLVIDSSSGRGIYMSCARENNINNLNIRNCKRGGLYLDRVTDSKVYGVTASFCDSGISLHGISGTKFVNCKAFGNNSFGWDINNNTNNVFTSCEGQDNVISGFNFSHVDNCIFNGIMLGGNGRIVSGKSEDPSEIIFANCANLIMTGYFRVEDGQECNQLITMLNKIKNLQINMTLLTSLNRKIDFLKHNNLIDVGTSIKINGCEIYNNNLISTNKISSVNSGILDGFELILDSKITTKNYSDGSKQILKIQENTSNESSIGIIGVKKQVSIDGSKIKKISFGAGFNGGDGTSLNDYYRVKVQTFWGGSNLMEEYSSTTYGGGQVLNIEDVEISDATDTIVLFFEIVVKNNNLKTYEIFDPKLMIGEFR